MDSKKNKVYAHFNTVDHYLNQQFDIRIRSEIVNELIGGEPENMNILDLGCGDGSISLQFQSETNDLTLVDLSENMLEQARLKILDGHAGHVALVRAEAESFSPDKHYEIIIATGLLAHVDSVEKTLELISKLLRPNGICLIQITDDSRFFSKLLKLYNQILDKLTGQFGYTRNRLSFSKIIDDANRYDLKYVKSQQYSLTLPGFTTLLPGNFMYKYHNFIRKNSFLSSFGTDFIIKFQKKI